MNGIILINKEPGYTSFDVCAVIRKLINTKKVGHTGTLDPDATGVLCICVGNATGLVSMLTEHDKEYICTMLLGTETDTYDTSGNVTDTGRSDFSRSEVEDVLKSFTGSFDQLPPMYSAIKVNGKRLYELARNGIEVERKARRIGIYGIELLSFEAPECTFSVSCSKGTYIRSLCHDIGAALSSCACMKKLIRTKTGDFSVENAYTLNEIRKMAERNDYGFLLPTESVIDLKRIRVKPEFELLLLNGNKLETEHFEDGTVFVPKSRYMVCDSADTFKGIYEYTDDKTGLFKPVKMFL